ncbi:MAG TPA: hypothetical protein VK849_03085 [Longimicrobiales bacterium]|nr:hypothetical protein [Longimicrobiales bacterium]
MKPRRTLGILLLLPAALLSCDDDCCGPLVCTEELRPGITVDVVEADTGVPAADGATLTLRDGDWVESTTYAYLGTTFAGAYERAGTYDVAVARAGYHTWIRAGVRVGADACHVHTVRLDAALERSGAGTGA